MITKWNVKDVVDKWFNKKVGATKWVMKGMINIIEINKWLFNKR